MKKIFTILYVLICFATQLFSAITYQEEVPYEREELSYIPSEILEKVHPYLLPKNHPVKAQLDEIFGKYRALKSSRAMKKAGFYQAKPCSKNMIVTGHDALRRYLIKAYLDTHDFEEWHVFCRRVQGSRTIQEEIEKRQYTNFFKVPKKWLYPLPEKPLPKPGSFRKYFVLVVEDMGLLPTFPNEDCYAAFNNKEMLEALYTMIVERKLVDSVYIDNIPFSYDGKIAFVDLEHFDVTSYPMKLHLLTRAFNSKMAHYWIHLIQNGTLDK